MTGRSGRVPPRMSRWAWLPVAASLAMSACVVGPNYERPTVDVPSGFRGADTSATAASLADERWWQVFEDEALRALIHTGLDRNDDLRLAAARILEAQAQLGAGTSAADLKIDDSAAERRLAISGLQKKLESVIAFEQGFRFIEISLAKLIERDRAKRRIIYVRRDGTRNRKRSH